MDCLFHKKMAPLFDSCKYVRDSKNWDLVCALFGILHIIDACTSYVLCVRVSLKDFVVKETLWCNVYGLSCLLLFSTVTAGVVLIYGIFMVKPCYVITYMILLGVTGIVAASLIAAFMAIIGYHAFFFALLIRIPFHMIGLILAYYTCKRLKEVVYQKMYRFDCASRNPSHNLVTIVEDLPLTSRPLYRGLRRFNSEVRTNRHPLPRQTRSQSIV